MKKSDFKRLHNYPKIPKKSARIRLPHFRLPTGLLDAAAKIKQLDVALALSLDEHRYKYGVYFSWVKKQVVHGNFMAWINAHTSWTVRTVQNYMKYAEQCERAGCLLK